MAQDQSQPQKEQPPKTQEKFDQTSTYDDSIQRLKPGTTLAGRYTIVRLIGAGGMGRVYLAQDSELGIDVALKVIRPDLLNTQGTIDRFKNELLIARKVSHKNVVRIHDIGEADGQKYLTMSYVPGKSLKDTLKESGPLSPSRVESIALQICDAVAVAHEEGVIHRDLKPANILIDENDRVFVTDFGIARSLDFSGDTETGHILGTPAYLSPEQSRGERVDARSDVYSLGLILYELAAGKLPFDQDTARRFRTTGPGDIDSTIKKIQSEIPSYYTSIIRKCLNPEPDARYSNAREVFEDLKSKNVKRQPFKINWVIAAVLVLLLLFVGLIVFKQIDPGISKPLKKEPSTKAPVISTRSIAILPFANLTGNSEMKWIETALSDLITTELSQISGYRLVSSDRIQQTLQDLKFSKQSLDSTAVKKLAEILDSDLMIHGAVVQAGTLLRADVKVTDSLHPEKTAHFKSTGTKPEDIFAMTEDLAKQIKGSLKSSGTSVSTNIPVISVEALKYFHQGNDSLREGDYSKAVDLYENSAKEAPDFHRAYMQMSFAYEKMGKPEQAVEALERAMQKGSTQDERSNLMMRARHSLLTGDLDKAIDTYNTLLQRNPDDSDALFQLAITYEEQGDLKNAVDTLVKVTALDPNHPQAYFHLGKDTVLMGEAEKGIHQYLLKALAIQTQLNNEYGKADVLNAIGVAYERLGRYDDAVRHYNDSIAIKTKIGNKKGEAKSLSNVAKIYLFQGEYDKATKILNRTSAIFDELQDPTGKADVLNMFGVMNEDQGKFDQALKHYKNAMQIRKQIGNDRLTAQSYDNVGQIYYLTGQYDEAEVYWEQALTLRRKIGEQSGVILSLQNMGFLQLDQGKLDDALKSFLDALEQSRSLKYENAIAVSLGNLGAIYQHQGRYNAAVDSYKQAIEILSKLEDKKGVAEYTRLLGSVYLEMNNTASAESQLTNAFNLAKEIQSFEMQTDSELLLAHLNLMKGDRQKATEHLQKAASIAAKNNYERGTLKAEIIQGQLLAETNPAESAAILNKAIKKATGLRNFWLILESRCALASTLLKTGKTDAAISAAETALSSARSVGSLPYQYRLYSTIGAAYKLQGDLNKARAQFEQANQALQRILEALKPEESNQIKKLPDSVQILQGLKETQAGIK